MWACLAQVFTRLRNLDEMRELATPPSAALALRAGKWTALSSNDLLPGDIIALTRAPPSRAQYTFNGSGAEVESACPADVVLLHGSVTVNESALTVTLPPAPSFALPPPPRPLPRPRAHFGPSDEKRPRQSLSAPQSHAGRESRLQPP